MTSEAESTATASTPCMTSMMYQFAYASTASAVTGTVNTLASLSNYLLPPVDPHQPLEYHLIDLKMSAPLEIQNVLFNQDGSSLTVCHDGGFLVYDLSKLDRSNGVLDLTFHSPNTHKTLIVERLFNSNLAMIVLAENSRRLMAYHFQRRDDILSNSYTSTIKAVKMNRKRVVVCLEEAIHVHIVPEMKMIHMIRDAPVNRDGIIDLCTDDVKCYLAYPGSATQGNVNIFDADQLAATCTIAAHEAPIAALKFNKTGTMLATASIKGTVIRVFVIPSGERLFEFTRGIRRSVTIHSLAFSADSKYLCSSSNTETVHVFSLERADELLSNATNQKAEEAEQGWVGYFTSRASNYLPQQINEIMLRETSFATARLPIVGKKTSCAMPRINNKDYLAVTSTDGYLFCYSLPVETGECTLARQFRIGPDVDETTTNTASEGRVLTAGSSPTFYPSLPREINHSEEASQPGPGLGTSPPPSSYPSTLKPGSAVAPPSPSNSDSGSSVGRVSNSSHGSGARSSVDDDHASSKIHEDESDDEDY